MDYTLALVAAATVVSLVLFLFWSFLIFCQFSLGLPNYSTQDQHKFYILAMKLTAQICVGSITSDGDNLSGSSNAERLSVSFRLWKLHIGSLEFKSKRQAFVRARSTYRFNPTCTCLVVI